MDHIPRAASTTNTADGASRYRHVDWMRDRVERELAISAWFAKCANNGHMQFSVEIPNNQVKLIYSGTRYHISFERKPLYDVLERLREIPNIRWEHWDKSWQMKGKSIVTWSRLYDFMGWLIAGYNIDGCKIIASAGTRTEMLCHREFK